MEAGILLEAEEGYEGKDEIFARLRRELLEFLLELLIRSYFSHDSTRWRMIVGNMMLELIADIM